MNGNGDNRERRELEERLREGEERLERLKGHARAYNTLLDRGSDYLEQAYDTYMGGDRVEDWESFERWMRAAVSSFKNAIAQLHKIAEITPSSVEPERYTDMEGLIRRTNDTLLNYHQMWGKRVIKEEHDRVMAMERWTCASLLIEGISHGDMESEAGEDYCHNKCPYREACDHEGL